MWCLPLSQASMYKMQTNKQPKRVQRRFNTFSQKNCFLFPFPARSSEFSCTCWPRPRWSTLRTRRSSTSGTCTCSVPLVAHVVLCNPCCSTSTRSRRCQDFAEKDEIPNIIKTILYLQVMGSKPVNCLGLKGYTKVSMAYPHIHVSSLKRNQILCTV